MTVYKNHRIVIRSQRNIAELLKDHEAVVVQLRKDKTSEEDNDDLGTADFFFNSYG
jgi:DNA-binding ferritin-like protein